MIEIVNATHRLYLDPSTGHGYSVDPDPGHDVHLGDESLHAAGWRDIEDQAQQLGWEPDLDDDLDAAIIGLTPEGGQIIAFVQTPDLTGTDWTAYAGTMADVQAAIERDRADR